MNRTTIWRAAGAALRTVRDGWLILGLALAVFLGLEVAYRAQAWLRGAIRLDDTVDTTGALDPLHPYAGSAWYPRFLRERGRLAFR